MGTFRNLICMIFYLGCSMTSIPTKGQQPDSAWTLGQCLIYADSANLDIKIELNNLQADELRITQAQSARLPNFSASASNNYNLENHSTAQSFSAGINSGITLYNGNKINSNITRYRQIYDQSQINLEYHKLALKENIISLYINALYCKESMKVSQQQFELSKQQSHQANEKYDIGLISRLDRLQLEADLCQAENNVLKAINQWSKAKLALMQTLDISYDIPFDIVYLSTCNAYQEIALLQTDSIFSLALRFRPELKSAIMELQIRDTDLKISRASVYPVLSVGTSGTYNIKEGEHSGNGIGATIGLNLNVPIFSHNENRAANKICKVNITDAKLNIEQQKRSIEKSIIELKMEIENQSNELQMYIKNEETALETYKLASEMFNNGQLSSLELLSRKNDYTLAQSNTIQARYNLLSARISLALFCGKFNIN